MEFEDSRNALFPEPNAYIQRFEKKEREKGIKKIIFQEPYESMPNFYMNNNFKKGNCDCIPNSHLNDCDCNHKHKLDKNQFNNSQNFDCYENKPNDNCHLANNSKQNGFGFDMKSLLPLMSLLNKGSGADFSQLFGLLKNSNNFQNGKNSNPMSLISSLLSNKDGLANILNLFKGGGLFGKKQTPKKEIKSTDFEIKNYTRVE